MNKSDRKYYIGLLVVTLVAIIIRLLRPSPIDWSEGYSASEKKPFGTFILFNELNELIPGRDIETNFSPVFELPFDSSRTNLIFINSALTFDEFETEILLQKVASGSSIFISAWTFEGSLADSLNIVFQSGFPGINPSISSLDSLLQRRVNFSNPQLRSSSKWEFPSGLVETYISRFDTAKSTVLGKVEAKRVNFLKYDYGDGQIFIHSNPFVFTNYFLRDIDRYDYAFKALSYLPRHRTLWDEYYKIGRQQFNSPMAYVASQPGLSTAWFIGIIGLIVYLIFGSKRKQRIIPELHPIKNTSVEFAQTISNLYLNNGTHAELLNKKLLFFKEYLRSNLGISTNFDQSDVEQTAQRSGLDTVDIEDLFSRLRAVESATEITTEQLKQITDQIDWFYKHTQR